MISAIHIVFRNFAAFLLDGGPRHLLVRVVTLHKKQSVVIKKRVSTHSSIINLKTHQYVPSTELGEIFVKNTKPVKRSPSFSVRTKVETLRVVKRGSWNETTSTIYNARFLPLERTKVKEFDTTPSHTLWQRRSKHGSLPTPFWPNDRVDDTRCEERNHTIWYSPKKRINA